MKAVVEALAAARGRRARSRAQTRICAVNSDTDPHVRMFDPVSDLARSLSRYLL